jgi:anti-anti-sigma factor
VPEEHLGINVDVSELGESSLSVEETSYGFRIAGELTESNAYLLAAATEDSVARGGELILDLAGLSYLDAAALHLLTEIGNRLDGRGRLILRCPDPWVRKVIGIAGLEHLGSVQVVEMEMSA